MSIFTIYCKKLPFDKISSVKNTGKIKSRQISKLIVSSLKKTNITLENV